MTNVITYFRVASDEDAEEQFKQQQDLVAAHCNKNGYTILQCYQEVYSGKTLNRPVWNKVIEFINSNPGKVAKIIVADINRVIRNFELLFELETNLKKMNIDIESAQQKEFTFDEEVLKDLLIRLPIIES